MRRREGVCGEFGGAKYCFSGPKSPPSFFHFRYTHLIEIWFLQNGAFSEFTIFSDGPYLLQEKGGLRHLRSRARPLRSGFGPLRSRPYLQSLSGRRLKGSGTVERKTNSHGCAHTRPTDRV